MPMKRIVRNVTYTNQEHIGKCFSMTALEPCVTCYLLQMVAQHLVCFIVLSVESGIQVLSSRSTDSIHSSPRASIVSRNL